MASGKTENYGLSQWEASDQVVRTDFNADNEKLDAAIKNAEDKADNAQNTANQVAAVAFTPDNLPFVVGTYKGNGAASRTISLGFTPQAVFVAPTTAEFYDYSSGPYIYGGLAVTGSNVSANTNAGRTAWESGYTAVMVTEGGFRVSSGNTGIHHPSANDSNIYYNYIAFR